MEKHAQAGRHTGSYTQRSRQTDQANRQVGRCADKVRVERPRPPPQSSSVRKCSPNQSAERSGLTRHTCGVSLRGTHGRRQTVVCSTGRRCDPTIGKATIQEPCDKNCIRVGSGSTVFHHGCWNAKRGCRAIAMCSVVHLRTDLTLGSVMRLRSDLINSWFNAGIRRDG